MRTKYTLKELSDESKAVLNWIDTEIRQTKEVMQAKVEKVAKMSERTDAPPEAVQYILNDMVSKMARLEMDIAQ